MKRIRLSVSLALGIASFVVFVGVTVAGGGSNQTLSALHLSVLQQIIFIVCSFTASLAALFVVHFYLAQEVEVSPPPTIHHELRGLASVRRELAVSLISRL